MADEVLQLLARALNQYIQQPATGQKAGGTPIGSYLYEAGGLFGRCDGAMTLINALVGPVGFEKYLLWTGTDTEKEFVDAWTDIVISSGEQTAVCGDCKTTTMKACAQFYCFGRFCRQSQELQFDRIGLRANSGVPIKNLFGAISGPTGEILVPMGSAISDDFYTQSALVGYAMRLKNAQMLWTGNPNNNTAAYQEYKGFQTIVNTGKFDSYTEQYCDALDAFLVNVNYNALTADDSITTSARLLSRRMVQQFRRRAEGAGLDWDTSTMYIVMTPNQWDCFARVYACSGVDLCNSLRTAAQLNVDASQVQARYEEYLTRMAIPIDGRWYPVVLDSQIPETTGQPNGVCSDIYFITTELSGRTVTYGQYQDFNKTYGRVRNELTAMFGSDDIAITDNGRFAVIRDNVRGCFDIQMIVKPRLVAEMPQLTGRLQHVCCNVVAEPFPDPSGSGRVYAPSGGRTTTPVPTLYGSSGAGQC